MFSTALLNWLTSDHGLMAIVQQNWVLGMGLIALVIFCETGLVVMAFLPGDSLLFVTGAFLGISDISPLLPVLMITFGAVLGDSANYLIGQSVVGRTLIRRNWVKPHHLAKTQDWFDRFGGSTIAIGRFVPIVRTVAPFLAGLSGMNTKRFLVYNLLGASAWCGSLLLAGYWLGSIPWVRGHIEWFSMVVVVLSLIPVAVHARSVLAPKVRTEEVES